MRHIVIAGALLLALAACATSFAKDAQEQTVLQKAGGIIRHLLEKTQKIDSEEKGVQRNRQACENAAKLVGSPQENEATTQLLALNISTSADMMMLQMNRGTYARVKDSTFPPEIIELYRLLSQKGVRQENFWSVPEAAWPLIGKLTSLEDLSITASNLPAVAWRNITSLPHLRRLRTCNCDNVTGDLLQLKNLKDLEYLDLDMGFVFQHPLQRKKMLGKLTDAEVIYRDEFVRKRPKWGVEVAEAAIITDRLIEQLATSTKLRAVKFTNTYISRRGVRALLAFPDLEEISINFLDHTIDEAKVVGSFPRLKKFQGLGFSDATFAELGKLQEIDDLFVSDRLTDASVAQMLRWTRLQRLTLWNNGLTDKGLVQLAELKALKQLDVRFGGKLTVQGAETFRKLRPDCKLWLVNDDLR